MSISVLNPDTPAYRGVDGHAYPLDVPRWRGDDGAPLSIGPLQGIGKAEVRSEVRSLWRYAAALPIAVIEPITMGEGCTPLVSRAFAGGHPLFKLEYVSPSGSFKDRGASVMLSMLRQQGVSAVLEDSSGNGGAAIAAYGAAGGMSVTILAPTSTSPAKTVAARVHGARVELVSGSRQDTADAAVARSADIFYASHNWQPFFLQGTKTLAYELWEDLGFRAPDNVIVSTGAGSNILGCDIGFSELLERGAIGALPRLFAAQPVNCAPIDVAFRSGSDGYVPNKILPTIAEGTAIARPVRMPDVLAAIRRSNGGTVAILEAEIVEVWRALAVIGFYVEPTCATAAAAYRSLLATGTITASETTIVVLTGAGTKATERATELLNIT